MNIAVLLTCFNRKDKTCACLFNVYAALKQYNDEHSEYPLSIKVFLVDDGCTDGTADEVLRKFPDVHIIQGTGSLFWAGGMRLAWSEAYKSHQKWNFYLLINDDTDIFLDAFSQLVHTHYYCIEQYGIGGIYTGATCDKDNHEECTYGGNVWVNRVKGLYKRIRPNGTPQMCDMTNANILLVSSDVVDKIGMLCKDYQHGMADYDYAIRARRKHIPALLTPGYCGACENDHLSKKEISDKIIKMSLSERIRYFNNPIHSNHDYIRFIYNTSPFRLPIVLWGRFLNLFFPRLYYRLRNYK